MQRESPIAREVLADIDAAAIVPGRPLVAIDADEVLLVFAEHLGRWLGDVGYDLKLTSYQLEGAIISRDDGMPVGFEAAISLIDTFFEEEAEQQLPLTGAVEAVTRLAGDAQVVVLTNIPRLARAARVRNLGGHGLDFPVVANSGGKGRALAMMASRAAAPAVFIDDSPGQIASAARHAEGVHRLHFRGSPFIQHVLKPAEAADTVAETWGEAEATIRRHLAL
ncbi:MAG: HAD family hydrolase [Pseudomonadota bacterium]